MLGTANSRDAVRGAPLIDGAMEDRQPSRPRRQLWIATVPCWFGKRGRLGGVSRASAILESRRLGRTRAATVHKVRWPRLRLLIATAVLAMCLSGAMAAAAQAVTFSGVVLGAGDVPLPGVRLDMGAQEVTTAANGAFAFTVAPGTYKLQMSGSRQSGVPSTAEPASFEIQNTTVTLTGSLEEDIPLPFHDLTVKTVNASDKPVSGVAIQGISSYWGIEQQTLAPGVVSGTWTDAAYGEVTNQEGEATIAAFDWASGAIAYAEPPAGSEYVRTEMPVSGITKTETGEVPLSKAVTFSGVVLGAGDVPLPGVRLDMGAQEVTTAANGAFAFTVAPGTYKLQMSGSRQSGVPSTAEPASFEIQNTTVTLTGSLEEDIPLPFHDLTVKTVNASDKPVSGVAIQGISSYWGIEQQTLAPGVVSGTWTDAAYGEVTNQEGEATIAAFDWASGAIAYAEPPAGSEYVRTEMPVSGITKTETREVPLSKAVTFSGVVLGAGDVPLPGVRLDMGAQEVTTAANGAFAFTVAPGTYKLQISGRDSQACRAQQSLRLSKSRTRP